MYSLYETKNGGYCIINNKTRFMLNSTMDKYKAVLICIALNKAVFNEYEVSNTTDVDELINLYKIRMRGD